MGDEDHEHPGAGANITPMSVDMDAIIAEIGVIGCYHLRTFIVIVIPVIVGGIHASSFIFAAEDEAYRCKVGGCDTNNGSGDAYETPWMHHAMVGDERCKMYAIRQDRIANETLQQCDENTFDKLQTLECDEFVFREKNTLVEELKIECQEWKRTLIGTVHNLGTLIALPIVGYVSDNYGRRKAMAMSCLLVSVFGVIKAFAVNYPMFLIFELLEPTFGSGLMSSAYVLTLELLPAYARVVGGICINVAFSIGEIVAGFVASLLSYWRTFLCAVYAPVALGIAIIWLVDESPRWLLNKHAYPKVLTNMTKAASVNGKTLTDKSLRGLKYNAEHREVFELVASTEEPIEKGKLSPYVQAFRSKWMVLRLANCCVWWITCTFCFYGLSINAVFLEGDKYMNFVYSSVVEAPGHLIAMFVLNKLGRKRTLIPSFTLCGLCCFAFAFLPKELSTIRLAAYLLAKLFIATSFDSVYLYTSELLPTSLRHSLLAFCSMIGRIGSISAPQTPLLTEIWTSLPTVMFGSLCFLSAALLMTSPETLGLRLPETLEEAQHISKLRKNSLAAG